MAAVAAVATVTPTAMMAVVAMFTFQPRMGQAPVVAAVAVIMKTVTRTARVAVVAMFTRQPRMVRALVVVVVSQLDLCAGSINRIRGRHTANLALVK